MSSYALGFHRLSTARTVYVVQRRRGLARHHTSGPGRRVRRPDRAGMGPGRLMGLSCGGAIAQHIGLDHPESVESLILVMSGAKLGTGGA